MLPAVVSSYYPPYEWLNFPRHEAEAGPSSAAPASRLRATTPIRTSSPMAILPARSPAPVGMMAARRGQPSFYTDSTAAGRAAPVGPAAPPSPPPAPAAAPRTIPTGHHHVPNGIGGHPNGEADDGGHEARGRADLLGAVAHRRRRRMKWRRRRMERRRWRLRALARVTNPNR
ncbi:unnamed protein product [Urochloa humidicola]